MAIAPGAVVGDAYRVDEEIDDGPPVATYRARRISDNALVTLKVLNRVLASDREHRGRFKREADLLARIRHPAVPQILDSRVDDVDQAFLALEHCTGETLSQRIERQRGLPLEQAMGLADWVLEVLEVMHAHDVVLRNLSPKNLVFGHHDQREIVRIVDLMAAHVHDEAASQEALTRSGAPLGAPEYMAPEQLGSRPLDGRTDLYSLGCVLYAMLVGEPPFPGTSTVPVLLAHARGQATPPGEARRDQRIPPELDAVVLRLLAKQPDQRYPDARSARAALTAAWSGMTVYSDDVDDDVQTTVDRKAARLPMASQPSHQPRWRTVYDSSAPPLRPAPTASTPPRRASLSQAPPEPLPVPPSTKPLPSERDSVVLGLLILAVIIGLLTFIVGRWT